MTTHPDRRRRRTAAGRIWAGRAMTWALARSGDPLARFLRPTPHDDVYALYDVMRRRGPVHRSRTGMYVVTSHDLCARILRDPRFRVRDAHGRPADHDPLGPDVAGPLAGSFLEQDPPDHTRLRRLVAPAFRPAVVRGSRERITAATDELLDRALRRDSFDLIADVAAPLPIRVITELLGVPAVDTTRFARIGTVVGQSLSGVFSVAQAEALRNASVDLAALFVRLAKDRLRTPGDDVISLLAAAHEDGQLDRDELVATCGLLLVAGFETTVNLIGNAVVALARNPEQWQLLRADPDRAAAVVEETLRFDPPVQATVRVAHEPVDLDGWALPAGARVALMLGAAHRDPIAYPDADRFDIARDRTGPDHLAFSSGIHYCLGAPLARLEGEIALRALATRLTRPVLALPPTRRRGNTVRGFATIPMSTGVQGGLG